MLRNGYPENFMIKYFKTLDDIDKDNKEVRLPPLKER